MANKKHRNNEEIKPVETTETEPNLAETAATATNPETEAPAAEEEEMPLEEAAGKLAAAYAALEKEHNALLASQAEEKDKLLRLQADFDNFRRRTRTEKEEWRLQIVADMAAELLPVLDNFQRAVDAMALDETAASHLEGVQMIKRQLMDVLANRGLQPLATAGENFDPNLHEAIGQVAVEDEAQVGKIIDEVQVGYKVGERLIRPAMVRVGKSK
mgnify:CR=1 FL=1